MVFDLTSYNLGHNILELDNVLVDLLLTTSKTKLGIIIANLVYLRVVSLVAEQLKT